MNPKSGHLGIEILVDPEFIYIISFIIESAKPGNRTSHTESIVKPIRNSRPDQYLVLIFIGYKTPKACISPI